jgi:chorismate mutase
LEVWFYPIYEELENKRAKTLKDSTKGLLAKVVSSIQERVEFIDRVAKAKAAKRSKEGSLQGAVQDLRNKYPAYKGAVRAEHTFNRVEIKFNLTAEKAAKLLSCLAAGGYLSTED